MKYKHYNFILVGAGLTNAVIANELCTMYKNGDFNFKGKRHPLRILVIDKRNHIAGNCYTENVNGIDVHKYGAHIFHTNNDWMATEYLPKFGKFHNYINQPIAIARVPGKSGFCHSFKAFNMPFNMNTFAQLFYDCVTPQDAKRAIQKDIVKYKNPKNLKEKALSMVGKTIFETLIEGYTEKQWGRYCEELPPEIITRLPLRFNYDNNYFTSKYQMIPDNGYTEIINNMLDHREVEIELGMSYKDLLLNYPSVHAERVYYSGCVDEFFEYQFGQLEYRTVTFKEKVYKTDNKQGTAVCNYTSKLDPYTRSIEHKWFNPAKQGTGTIVSYEYPQEWKRGMIPSYPVNTEINNAQHTTYLAYASQTVPNVRFVGRLGKYKYMDMDVAIADAINMAKQDASITLE